MYSRGSKGCSEVYYFVDYYSIIENWFRFELMTDRSLSHTSSLGEFLTTTTNWHSQVIIVNIFFCLYHPSMRTI
jgi:hypothetical protein